MKLSQLTEQRRQLVRTMQQLHYGRIEGLLIRDGQPDFSRPYQTIREIVFGKSNLAVDNVGIIDFELRSSVVELCKVIDQLPSGAVVSLQIQDGLPFRMQIAETGPP